MERTALKKLAYGKIDRSIEGLFENESQRFENFSKNIGGILFDFSKSQISQYEMEELAKYADECGVKEMRKKMFDGDAINFTENRSVLHVALRNKSRKWKTKGQDLDPAIAKNVENAENFAKKVFHGEYLAKNGKPFSAIIHIGIGGSDFGPRLVYDALRSFQSRGPIVRFCANVDPNDFAQATNGLDPHTTLIVCVSKTFTTIETMTNLALARSWLQSAIGEDDKQHLVAISSAPNLAIAAGFDANNIFGFEEWVGGRFSLWSTVGLSLNMSLGQEVVDKLHAGAALMDSHFENEDLLNNIPVIAGMLGYWNHSCLEFPTRTIIPYAQRLKLLPQFLQQLDMESNGKGVDKNNNQIWHSGPVVWGSEGTNAQHAFFQHLHQSPQITPLEFVVIIDDGLNFKSSTRLTIANALAQSEALMRGKSLEAVQSEMKSQGKSDEEITKIAPQRVFTGNRPSIMTILPRLGPYELGILLAFYEHRTFVEGILWNINSFDQWGVELGKVIAKEINDELENGSTENRDISTRNLINFIRSHEN